jgi:hypothetical protein
VDDFRQMASDDTVALARAAAEAIRGLNHATGCDAGLGQPPAACDVTGALSLAASRPGQLLTQITGYPDRSLQAGRPGHDPAPDINGAGAFPGDARLSAAALAGDLSQAREQLAHAGGCPARRNPRDQT